MTLTHITIPTAILRLKDLNLRQKVLLGLIISFNEKGLKMSNKALGEILDIWPSRVSKLLKDMAGPRLSPLGRVGPSSYSEYGLAARPG